MVQQVCWAHPTSKVLVGVAQHLAPGRGERTLAEQGVWALGFRNKVQIWSYQAVADGRLVSDVP